MPRPATVFLSISLPSQQLAFSRIRLPAERGARGNQFRLKLARMTGVEGDGSMRIQQRWKRQPVQAPWSNRLPRLIGTGVSLFALAFFLAGCSHPEEEPPKVVVNVKVARADVADIDLTVQAPATIFPREQANISARITAPILSLKARKGDSISANQVLAVLENRDAEAQQAEASANLADAEATLQKMSAGTLPADLERARGALESAEAARNLAQKNYDRRKELFAQGAISNRDLLTSETELSQARTAYDVAKRTLNLLEEQSGKTDILIAQTRVQQARARRSLADAQLQFTELHSPLTGTITEQFLYPGDMAKPDTPIFTVMDLSVAVARAQVPESDARRVMRGQPCGFSTPGEGSTTAKGSITVVNQAVDPARRTVEVWCEIPNQHTTLKAGVFGALSITVGRATHAIVLPESAVQFKEGSSQGTAVVVDPQHVAHLREVEATVISGKKVQINRGIAAGEIVAIEGAYGLAEGTQVSIVEDKQ
jgi:HlyD family secretion protein